MNPLRAHWACSWSVSPTDSSDAPGPATAPWAPFASEAADLVGEWRGLYDIRAARAEVKQDLVHKTGEVAVRRDEKSSSVVTARRKQWSEVWVADD